MTYSLQLKNGGIEMNSRMLEGFNKTQTDWEDLLGELDSVKDDIRMIQGMKVSEEMKLPILAELQKQANDVKEKMHDYIDSL